MQSILEKKNKIKERRLGGFFLLFWNFGKKGPHISSNVVFIDGSCP
jgi:hypothetical protein